MENADARNVASHIVGVKANETQQSMLLGMNVSAPLSHLYRGY